MHSAMDSCKLLAGLLKEENLTMPRFKTSRSLLSSIVLASSIGFSSTLYADAQLYESALADAQQGDVRSAVIKIKNILRDDPENLPTRLLYADILQQYGEFTAAQEQYERALQLNADQNLVIVPLTRILLMQGQYNDVLQTATITGRPFDIQLQLMLLRGDAYLGMRDFVSAQREYQRVLQQRTDDVIALLGLAQIEFAKGNAEAFKNQIEKAKALYPSNPNLWYLEGRFEQKRHNTNRAHTLYSKAIELNPNDFDSRKARAAIALDQGDIEKAEEDITFMLSKVSDDPYTLFLNAMLLRQRGAVADANSILSDLSNQFSVVPEDVLDQHFDLKKAKAITEFMLGNYLSAENVLTQMIASSPSDGELRALIAKTLSAQGQTRRAIDHLQVIPVNELSLETAKLYVLSLFESEKYFDLVSLYDRLPAAFQQASQIKNMYSVARINTRQLSAVDVDNKNQSERLILGYGFLQTGDLESAAELANQIESTSKEQLNFKGSVELALGNWTRALELFESALQFDAKDHIVNLNIAQVLIAQGQLARANDILVEQESAFPEDLRVKFQLARVSQLQGNYARASQYYESINAQSPLEVNTLFNWLDVSLAANQFNQALSIARQLEQINKFAPPMLIGKAKAQMGLRDNQGAVRSLRVLLGIVGESAPHLIEIGEMMASLGEQDGLREVIDRLKGQANHKQSVNRLQVLLAKNSGDLATAITLANRVAAQTRLDSDYRTLSQLYFEQGNVAKAIEFAELTVEQSQTNEHIPFLTSLYWQSGEKAAAESLLSSWIIENPEDEAIRRVLANFYQQTGKFTDAKTHYLQLLIDTPEDAFSLINLTVLFTMEDSLSRAEELISRLPSLYADEPIVIDLKGWLMFQSGNKQEGLALMRESYAKNARNQVNLFHLGAALLDQGRDEQGKQMLKRYLELATPATKTYTAKANALLSGI